MYSVDGERVPYKRVFKNVNINKEVERGLTEEWIEAEGR